MNTSDIDPKALFDALDSKRRALSLSWAGLTREINSLFREVPCPPIATSTITTLETKREVIGNAALQMMVWLNRTPESFIPGNGNKEAPQEALPRLEPDRILRFDTQALFRALDLARQERGLTWKQVAEEIGNVNPLQLKRFADGGGIGIVMAGRIARWLGRPVASFTVASRL